MLSAFDLAMNLSVVRSVSLILPQLIVTSYILDDSAELCDFPRRRKSRDNNRIRDPNYEIQYFSHNSIHRESKEPWSHVINHVLVKEAVAMATAEGDKALSEC